MNNVVSTLQHFRSFRLLFKTLRGKNKCKKMLGLKFANTQKLRIRLACPTFIQLSCVHGQHNTIFNYMIMYYHFYMALPHSVLPCFLVSFCNKVFSRICRFVGIWQLVYSCLNLVISSLSTACLCTHTIPDSTSFSIQGFNGEPSLYTKGIWWSLDSWLICCRIWKLGCDWVKDCWKKIYGLRLLNATLDNWIHSDFAIEVLHKQVWAYVNFYLWLEALLRKNHQGLVESR